MDAYACPSCGQLVFFHNSVCLRCGAELAFDPDELRIVTVGATTARCRNLEVAGCNWAADADGELCRSCALTRTRPADADGPALARFATAEAAKRQLIHQLLRLGLPVTAHDAAAGTGVAFDLLSSASQPVTTGHAGGVITLDLAESDAAHRERVRTKLSEPYRTVLGHFRHEIGHYLFPLLVTADDRGEARWLFGDERRDYEAALDRHYRDGAPAGWEDEHVSEYATMHPAEDWAETFAHYLHIHAVLNTAAAYRVTVGGPSLPGEQVATPVHLSADPVHLDLATADIQTIVAAWLPLSYAINAINRSLGEDDLYPFVLPAAVIAKLGFVHRVVQQATPW